MQLHGNRFLDREVKGERSRSYTDRLNFRITAPGRVHTPTKAADVVVTVQTPGNVYPPMRNVAVRQLNSNRNPIP